MFKTIDAKEQRKQPQAILRLDNYKPSTVNVRPITRISASKNTAHFFKTLCSNSPKENVMTNLNQLLSNFSPKNGPIFTHKSPVSGKGLHRYVSSEKDPIFIHQSKPSLVNIKEVYQKVRRKQPSLVGTSDPKISPILKDLLEIKSQLNLAQESLESKSLKFKSTLNYHKNSILDALDHILEFAQQVKKSFLSQFEQNYESAIQFMSAQLKVLSETRLSLEGLIDNNLLHSDVDTLDIPTIIDNIALPKDVCYFPELKTMISNPETLIGDVVSTLDSICSPKITFVGLKSLDDFNRKLSNLQKKIDSNSVRYKQVPPEYSPKPVIPADVKTMIKKSKDTTLHIKRPSYFERKTNIWFDQKPLTPAISDNSKKRNRVRSSDNVNEVHRKTSPFLRINIEEIKPVLSIDDCEFATTNKLNASGIPKETIDSHIVDTNLKKGLPPSIKSYENSKRQRFPESIICEENIQTAIISSNETPVFAKVEGRKILGPLSGEFLNRLDNQEDSMVKFEGEHTPKCSNKDSDTDEELYLELKLKGENLD